MKLLSVENRQEYLTKLPEFLKMDNDRNWRFRLELAEQLEQLIPLFEPVQVEEHISPIAMELVHDKVAAVRQTATGVIATIVKSLTASSRLDLAANLLQCVTESLVNEPHWVHRQTFATLCLKLFQIGAVR